MYSFHTPLIYLNVSSPSLSLRPLHLLFPLLRKFLPRFSHIGSSGLNEIFPPQKSPGFPGGTSGKEPACHCRRLKRCGFCAWVGKIPWRRARQPTPVFLPGESHGQKSLVGYSPQGRKELDTTEATQHACGKPTFTTLFAPSTYLQFYIFLVYFFCSAYLPEFSCSFI